MLQKILNRTAQIILSLRLSILSIFISLFVISMLVLIGVSYARFMRTVSFVSFQSMKQAAELIYDDLVDELNDVATECEFAKSLIQRAAIDSHNPQSLIDYTYDFMSVEAKSLPSVQSAFWGDINGNFVSSDKVENKNILTEVMRRDTTFMRKLYTHDEVGNLIKTEDAADIGYDPRKRPWFIAAQSGEKVIWTDIFPYRINGYLGITAAAPVYSDTKKFLGVFALNLRLDYLRHFIERQKISEHGIVFLMTDQGKVIAYPNIEQYRKGNLMSIQDVPLPWVVASFAEYQKQHQQEFVYDFDGKKYLAVYKPMPHLATKGWLIAVVAPEYDFVSEIIKTNYITIVIAIAILLIGIALMSRLVNRIVTPMKRLVKETNRIRHLDLEGGMKVKSRIKEIIALSDAIYAMKKGLRSFQKYVPATLVRQLIDSGQDVLIGGEKKTLAILFSDIQDFTKISEHMEPQLLMEHLCEYFEAMSHIIAQERGTVDKYIGDALMAFWGAPLPEEYPCQQAARAALLCAKKLAYLNEKWRMAGKPPLYTRMGIHFGEVIVGNLGSSTRMNYTAIGDAINVTSRLESINKIYNSHIIASEAVYLAIKNQFVFRFLDRVVVKGKEKVMSIYELLGDKFEKFSFDLDAYNQAFSKAYACYSKHQWDEAIAHFKHCVVLHPEDQLAHLYVARCEEFKLHPPKADWNGVWVFKEK